MHCTAKYSAWLRRTTHKVKIRIRIKWTGSATLVKRIQSDQDQDRSFPLLSKFYTHLPQETQLATNTHPTTG